MPNLKALLDDPSALRALVEEMSHPDPIREEPRLNHGIKSFEELELVVCQPPFDDDDERELEQVYAAARVMTSR